MHFTPFKLGVTSKSISHNDVNVLLLLWLIIFFPLTCLKTTSFFFFFFSHKTMSILYELMIRFFRMFIEGIHRYILFWYWRVNWWIICFFFFFLRRWWINLEATSNSKGINSMFVHYYIAWRIVKVINIRIITTK